MYRVGRSSRLEIDRAGAEPIEVTLRRQPNDLTRQALLAALVAGRYGAVDRSVAMEAMGAEW